MREPVVPVPNSASAFWPAAMHSASKVMPM